MESRNVLSEAEFVYHKARLKKVSDELSDLEVMCKEEESITYNFDGGFNSVMIDSESTRAINSARQWVQTITTLLGTAMVIQPGSDFARSIGYGDKFEIELSDGEIEVCQIFGTRPIPKKEMLIPYEHEPVTFGSPIHAHLQHVLRSRKIKPGYDGILTIEQADPDKLHSLVFTTPW